MAALLCVCLVLALWMTGSRPAAGPRAGSPDSSSHWDQAYFQITDRALRSRRSGDLCAPAPEPPEMNRAASLRESLARADVWRQKLPAEYWEAVGRLEAPQSTALRTAGSNFFSSDLLLRIAEMEADAGLGFAVRNVENFRNRTSLTDFRVGLAASELFLSFFLESSLQGVLVQVPHAALAEGDRGHTGYPVERHSIQTVPRTLTGGRPAGAGAHLAHGGNRRRFVDRTARRRHVGRNVFAILQVLPRDIGRRSLAEEPGRHVASGCALTMGAISIRGRGAANDTSTTE